MINHQSSSLFLCCWLPPDHSSEERQCTGTQCRSSQTTNNPRSLCLDLDLPRFTERPSALLALSQLETGIGVLECDRSGWQGFGDFVADDLAVGPHSGKVYLFYSTDILAADKPLGYPWDLMFASKLDMARGLSRGRLLEYDPSTDETMILMTGLRFPNGIAVSKDESLLFMA